MLRWRWQSHLVWTDLKSRSHCGGNEKKFIKFFLSLSVVMECVLDPIMTATATETWVSWQQVVVFILWRQMATKGIEFFSLLYSDFSLMFSVLSNDNSKRSNFCWMLIRLFICFYANSHMNRYLFKESLRQMCCQKLVWLEWVQGRDKGLPVYIRKICSTRNLVTGLRSSKKSKRH